MSGQYNAAVEWAKSEFQNDFPKRPFDFAGGEPTHFALRQLLQFDPEKDGFGYDPKTLPFLVKWAETNRGAFEMAWEIVSNHLELDVPLPKELKDWVIDTLYGSRPRPKKTIASKTFFRNLMLLGLVYQCADLFELRRTRNSATEPRSACDAVAEALCQSGYAITERALKELLTHKSSENLREIAELYRLREYDIEWDMSECPDLPRPPDLKVRNGET